jgi:cellulose synthase/poly-beta-1,6-N-acetylglucosamine synthase-like glycosyltransferase
MAAVLTAFSPPKAWGYYNLHYSLLTEADALGLDMHHTVEQPARAYCHGVFGFNGTGGVWRKQAIRDAGGWTADTVTEDLSISYLAALQGYKMEYVADAPQKLELPSSILLHIQQKQRWTKGFFQVVRLYYWNILCSRTISIGIKVEAFVHFTSAMQLFAATAGILLYPWIVIHQIQTPLMEAVSIFPVIEPICAAIHAILTKAPSHRFDYQSLHSRISRILVILPYFALRFGMVPFEIKAICEGLCSNDATFHTTPKLGGSDDGSHTATTYAVKATGTTNKPAIHSSRWNDVAALFGLLVGLHQFSYVMMLDRHFEHNTFFDR